MKHVIKRIRFDLFIKIQMTHWKFWTVPTSSNTWKSKQFLLFLKCIKNNLVNNVGEKNNLIKQKKVCWQDDPQTPVVQVPWSDSPLPSLFKRTAENPPSVQQLNDSITPSLTLARIGKKGDFFPICGIKLKYCRTKVKRRATQLIVGKLAPKLHELWHG